MVIDLFARNVVVWRRKPAESVMVHSDQGKQYGSDDWQRFCRANNLTPNMSRRGNCWDIHSNQYTFKYRIGLTRAGIGSNAFVLTCRSILVFPGHNRAQRL